jgi:hypothetical protein
MKRLSFCCLVLFAGIVAFGGTARAEEDAALEAMHAIASFEGRWEGEGWARMGPTEPVPFTSTEVVESRLEGRVLIVEGLHYGKESGEVVHHALATISWDSRAGKYRFRSHLASGRSGDHEAELLDGKFVWGMEIPDRGRIRYTITIEDDTWHEIGEFSADGVEWHQTFQMDLKRVGDS